MQLNSKLGPYQIKDKLGAGGMGEVYRATDTRLDRTVAIKVLPAHFATDPARRDRFEREARIVSSLNHPHICTLHDVGEQEGVYYLVMELVDGETLEARLTRGHLPWDTVLKYAIQIADALEKAHRQGVVHRDLKPGNIMLTKSGVKLLDFGLAKLKGDSSTNAGLSQAPTRDMSLTAEGTILGTLQYMAPEQLEGHEADNRTDIFAFGAVMYEMITGKKPFEGRSPASLTAKILESDPVPILSLQPMAPAALDRLVATCLAKDPDNRFQSAHDFKLELEWIRDAAAESPQSAAVPASTRWRRVLPWALSVVTALSFAVFAWVHEKSTTLQTEPVRFEIPLPTKHALRLTTSFTLSPDGRQLAFAAVSTDGIRRIWIRPLNSLEIRPLPGTESVGGLLIWSPDSRFIAFNSGGKLQKIDVSGGPAKFVCNLSFVGVGGSWSRNGVVLFGGVGGVIMRVSEDGGVATPVTVLDSAHGDVAHTNPYFLPDGRHFVYLRDTGTSGAISVGSLDVKPEEQDPTRLVEGVYGPRYAPSSSRDVGQLLFRRGQTLMAQQFDAVHFKLKGDPLRVVEAPVGTWADDGHFSVSNDDILVYRSPTIPQSQITWVDAQGKVLKTVGSAGSYVGLDLSREGTAALVVRSEPNAMQAVLLIDLSSGISTLLANEPSTDYPAAIWSPDGSSMIVGLVQPGRMADIYQKPIKGTGDAEALFKSDKWKDPLSSSPDGFLLFDVAGRSSELWMLPLKGKQKPVPLLQGGSNYRGGHFSPDGHWVAYVSDESGRPEVYVGSFSPKGLSNPQRVSGNGGNSVRWGHDGKLYYIDLDKKLMAVKLTLGSAFQVGVPTSLFQAPGISYSPSPDGKFLFLVPQAQEEVPLTVVLNWQAGLKK